MTTVSSKDPSSNDISNEESGWTTYFEDFFNNNNIDDDDDNNQHKSSLSLSRVASSSSLLSDATSLVEKKVADDIVEYEEEEVSVNKNGRESSFKKRKNITNDALEDTATSPLNSSKVLYANQQFDTPKEQPEVGNFSQEKGNISGQKELSFIGKDSDSTGVKDRGLCVVPMSMVVANHIV